ncbi:MAG: hypothetical protein AAFR84_01140 [Pseudomonadota bacterium]
MAKIETTSQAVTVDGVSETIISEPALNPITGKWERYIKIMAPDGDAVDGSSPVLDITLSADDEESVQITVPEHGF